ncbi:hypothetical protein HPB50_014499 [Hyalomma asiaticum]|uniref:Uncharacterized protein n=1 Tax=Hyalomma asiaticum TaxID=266040 RepID=A0ACB7SFK1_HYAAI|nr:hypothetical protein HPB50_014499 [Hyalomma asiaticum]
MVRGQEEEKGQLPDRVGGKPSDAEPARDTGHVDYGDRRCWSHGRATKKKMCPPGAETCHGEPNASATGRGLQNRRTPSRWLQRHRLRHGSYLLLLT